MAGSLFSSSVAIASSLSFKRWAFFDRLARNAGFSTTDNAMPKVCLSMASNSLMSLSDVVGVFYDLPFLINM